MKRVLPVFVIIIMIAVLLVLAGCAASGPSRTQTGDSPVAVQTDDSASNQTTDSTAGMVIASNEISPDGGYAFSIVMTNGRFEGGGTFLGIDGGGTFTGSFDIVLYDGVEEKDRMSLNDVFGQDSLSFAAHVFSNPATPRYIQQNTLFGSDYNSDGNIDVAIGFEESDTPDESRYAIFSVNDEGRLCILPTTGYKEDGFVYSKTYGNNPEFREMDSPNIDDSTAGIAAQPLSFSVGVKENGIFVPAKYVWDGNRFVFEKPDECIIAQETVPGKTPYTVKIVQTQFSQPLVAPDINWSMYKSYILGQFDVVTMLGDKEISKLELNSLFDGQDIGWIGPFEIALDDYNGDGQYEFVIPQLDRYVMIGIAADGALYRVRTIGYPENGFIYDVFADGFTLEKLPGPETGIVVNCWSAQDWHYYPAEYLWDSAENAFVFHDAKYVWDDTTETWVFKGYE